MSSSTSSKAVKSNSTTKQTSSVSKKTPTIDTTTKDGKVKNKSFGETKKVQLDPKVYNACKKEVNADIRRLKAEASSQVLVVFDTEEDYEERFVAPMSLNHSLAFTAPELNLDALIQQIPDCDLMSLLKESPSTPKDDMVTKSSISGENSTENAKDAQKLTMEHWGDLLRISMCFFSYNALHQFPRSFLSLDSLAHTLVRAQSGGGEDEVVESQQQSSLTAAAEVSKTSSTDARLVRDDSTDIPMDGDGDDDNDVEDNKEKGIPDDSEVSMNIVKDEVEVEVLDPRAGFVRFLAGPSDSWAPDPWVGLACFLAGAVDSWAPDPWVASIKPRATAT